MSTANAAARLDGGVPERPRAAEPIASSPAMREVMEAAADVAATPTTVLLLGESGTGKELLARFLHERSGRTGAWVAVNGAALPGDLLASELFGPERGAFTGAWERRAGRFEQAEHGTLLLDEISELPLPLQAKLLRVLQEREIDRVGGHRPLPIDVRVVATANRDLGEMARRGLFRTDLYYRLSVFPIVLPPLRDRAADLEPLARALLADTARALGRPAPELDPSALDALRDRRFPGNVRELRNVLERAVVRCREPRLTADHLRSGVGLVAVSAPPRPGAAPDPASDPVPAVTLPGPALPLDLGELERLAIAEALRRVNGNRTHAARLLGIGLRTLRNKLRLFRETGVGLDAAGPAGGPVWPGGAAVPSPIPEMSRASVRARASQEETLP